MKNTTSTNKKRTGKLAVRLTALMMAAISIGSVATVGITGASAAETSSYSAVYNDAEKEVASIVYNAFAKKAVDMLKDLAKKVPMGDVAIEIFENIYGLLTAEEPKPDTVSEKINSVYNIVNKISLSQDAKTSSELAKFANNMKNFCENAYGTATDDNLENLINTVNANNNRQYNVNVVSPEIQNSYFDGNMWQLLGWNLLCGLITFITLGFGGPWARVLKIRWQTKHTVINGKRLYFNGTAPQLFGKLILWWLLLCGVMLIPTIAGIVTGVKTGGYYYSTYFDASNLIFALVIDAIIVLFASPAFDVYIKKWETKHTAFIDDNGIGYNHMSNGQIYYAPTPQNYSGYSNQNIYYQNQNIQNGYTNEYAAQNNIGTGNTPNNCHQNNNQ